MDWELSASGEKLSSEDEIENVPDCLVRSDGILPAASNSDQLPVSSNPSIADGTAVADTAKDGTTWVSITSGSETEGGDEMSLQKNRFHPGGGVGKCPIHLWVHFNCFWTVTQFPSYKAVQNVEVRRACGNEEQDVAVEDYSHVPSS